jgi:glucose-1-phosphate cytidylyltransferase
MKTVILAGGLGTRLAEETEVRPKPMIEIGGRPILWHIMKHYASFGFKEFLIALGYKGEVIKRYFVDYYGLTGSMSINLANGEMANHEKDCEDWIVHLIDTGLNTNSGGRVKRLASWLRGEPFLLTYGDGVADVNLHELIAFHRTRRRLATVTAVRPPARFGGVIFDGDLVSQFTEKPQIGEGWINGGFLVCEPEVLRYLDGDDSSFEIDALMPLADARQLAAYRHHGFWQCMDTLRDKRQLEEMWHKGNPPWRAAA